MNDDTNMISERTGSRIKRKIYNATALQTAFKLFVLREKHCKQDILDLMETFTKIIVKNGSFVQSEDIGDYTLDDFVNIADSYANIMALLQNSFAAGLLYGRARFDQNFWKDFGVSNSELNNLLKDHIDSMDGIPFIHEEDETDIEDFTDNNNFDRDDDKDPLDDIF